jgi:flagellum-specific ATP synthase
MPTIADQDHQNLANGLRRLWTLYQQNQDLINVGAYEAGSNPDLDRAIAVRGDMENFLRQPMHEQVTADVALAQLQECLANG